MFPLSLSVKKLACFLRKQAHENQLKMKKHKPHKGVVSDKMA